MRGQSELAIFGLQAIDVNRSIGRLGRDEFIERIPRDTLHIVRVLGNLPYHLPLRIQCQHSDLIILNPPGVDKTNRSEHCKFEQCYPCFL